MKQDRYDEGRFSAGGAGLGTVTEEMVRERAKELALINGREQLLDSDLEQARRELQGEERLYPENTPAEDVTEEDRWNPVKGSTGDRTEAVPAPDEQTFAEKLVEEGVEEAEHDQMVRATKAGLEEDKQAEP